MNKTNRLPVLLVALFAAIVHVEATTELFNLNFDDDLSGFAASDAPIVPTVIPNDIWTKSIGHVDGVSVDGYVVGRAYMFNGNVRGLSISLSSGFTPGTRYTLSARARKFYGGNNQRVVIAATQASAGTSGDYLMDNLYNGTDEAYQPVVVNSGDASVSNVLLKTLNVDSTWKTVADTFVYDGSLGPDVAVQIQFFDTSGTTDGAIYYDDFILSDNRAPQFSTSLIEAPTGYVGVAYSLALSGYASDLEGDPTTYEKDAGDTSWINISSSGLVTGTPDVAGTNTVTVYAWDNLGETNSATLRIVVSNVNLPPSWAVSGGFDMGYAAVSQPVSDSLATRAIDLNGEPITYSEVGSGPAWLTIGSGGAISGTPDIGDIGTNSWSVAISDGELSSTSSFEIVVIEGVQVYEESFSPSVDLAGSFNNTIGGALFAYVTTEVQEGMWAHTFSTNSDSFNLWDNIGLADVLEFAENGAGTKAEGVGTFIPESALGGQAGRYVLTYSFVAKDYYGAESRVGARIFEAARGSNLSSSNDYFLGLQGDFVFNLGVGAPAGSDAYVSPLLASDAVSSALGYRSLEFTYSGTNDVVLIFGTSSPDGRARAAIDNVRVFKLPLNYDEWESGYGLLLGKQGDDDGDGVDNLTEFGLGLDPTEKGGLDDGMLPRFYDNGSGLIYVMAQRNSYAPLEFKLLTRDNLLFGAWSTNNVPTDYTVIGSETIGSFDFVTNLIDTTAEHKFIKPLVTESP